MIVYLVTNLINGKKYVGYTQKSLEERKEVHLCKSKSKNNKHFFYLFPSAIRKYGIENFKWEILFEGNDLAEVLKLEIHYIKTLNTIAPNGYNLTKGGNGGIPSEITKDKISESLKKYYAKNGHVWSTVDSKTRKEWANKSWDVKRKKGYIPPKGHTHTEEAKEAMSVTKNEKNKVMWLNVFSGEEKCLSPTKMAEYTNLSVGVFNHLKNGRQKQTKCGWTYKSR